MSVLDELVTGAVEDQQAREQKIPLDEVKRQAFAAPAPIDARQWLKKGDGIPVIGNQKSFAIERPPERYSRSSCFGQRIREGWSQRDFRAYRGTSLFGIA